MRATHLWLLCLLFAFGGCRKAMQVDGRIKPLQESNFFADGATARAPVAGTIARGELREDSFFWRGEVEGRLATSFPAPVTMEMLARGQERFEIYCAVCHGRTGRGDGMIVARGFPAPPTFHQERLREAVPGYFFGVITHGYGAMYSYADRVSAEDRWAIIAYIRALQLSQNATMAEVPKEALTELEAQ